MKKISIVITTFSKRLNFAKTLISQIRQQVDYKIVLVINGEKDGEFDETYRKQILEVARDHSNVYPIFFIETRGLSKMWNTGIIATDTDDVLVLNDDVEIHSNNIFEVLKLVMEIPEYEGLARINRSFSHFLINKNVLDKLGYFDERLLGFGEEDGDIYFSLLKNGLKLHDTNCQGLHNIVSDIRHDYIKPGVGKYSKFNREFAFQQKYQRDDSSPYQGMFDYPCKEVLVKEQQYPYEKFYREHKNEL
jgi:glycosyltransferase involved in cell wall biosynthesis